MEITLNTTEQVATLLLTQLNMDAAGNFPYTQVQFDRIKQGVAEMWSTGYHFTEESYYELGDGGEAFLTAAQRQVWAPVADTLQAIWDGEDENGNDLPEREQTLDCDPTPRPIPA